MFGTLENHAAKRHQAFGFRYTVHYVLQASRKVTLQRLRIRLQIAIAQMREVTGIGYFDHDAKAVHTTWFVSKDHDPFISSHPVTVHVQV